MTRTCGISLALMLMASSAYPAGEGPSQPQVAIVTGEIRNPVSRELVFTYNLPSALEDFDQDVALDSLNRFAFELPAVRGTVVSGRYEGGEPRWKWVQWLGAVLFDHDPLAFFVEPGDSLHVAVDEGVFSPSIAFSGPNADNSRFIAEWFPRFYGFRLDYEDLEVEEFRRQMDERRQDQLDFFAERRGEYSLSPGFVDFATAYVNYEWAEEMISYPEIYRAVNGRYNEDIPPDYFDFLQEVPLVDENALGVRDYRRFLDRTFYWEWNEGFRPRSPRLSDMYDLSALGLSDSVRTRLDSLYKKDGWRPALTKMVDLSSLGFSDSLHTRLDSLYDADGRYLELSEMYDLSSLGLSDAAQAHVDSLFRKNGFSSSSSSDVEAPRVDTTGGRIRFHMPPEVPLDSLRKEPPRLSKKIDLSALGLSGDAQVQLDSLYEHRRRLALSERIDLSSLGLSAAARTQLDSLYADLGSRTWLQPWRTYELAGEKLEGRVLYWYLAGELIDRFEDGQAFAFAHRKWEGFQAANPYPELAEAVQAAVDKALKLQPGQPAPEFTLDDLHGQPVSLSQFKGQVVLLDFWASWCGPCIGALPDIRRLKKETADLPVVFLNLSIDRDEAAWREAIDEHQIKGVHVRASGWDAEVAESYQVRSIPSYYLVDSRGLIVERLSGVRDTNGIVETIEESL